MLGLLSSKPASLRSLSPPPSSCLAATKLWLMELWSRKNCPTWWMAALKPSCLESLINCLRLSAVSTTSFSSSSFCFTSGDDTMAVEDDDNVEGVDKLVKAVLLAVGSSAVLGPLLSCASAAASTTMLLLLALLLLLLLLVVVVTWGHKNLEGFLSFTALADSFKAGTVAALWSSFGLAGLEAQCELLQPWSPQPAVSWFRYLGKTCAIWALMLVLGWVDSVRCLLGSTPACISSVGGSSVISMESFVFTGSLHSVFPSMLCSLLFSSVPQ
mmetsp:Transcript_13682/g.26536  ORF Transcript_13682/g.26536 Transcript_13682/m.26536 type:complete len:271 (+) Transcript_13682:1770-2582(+)